jgi:hypothetical protein
MQVNIKEKSFNLTSEAEYKKAERFKEKLNNTFDRVDTIVTGLDSVIIRGTTLTK